MSESCYAMNSSDCKVPVPNKTPSKVKLNQGTRESVVEAKHGPHDNFGRLHPIFKINGFMYSTQETLKQIQRMRKNISQYEKITNNHFFVTNRVSSIIQDQHQLARLQKKQ